MKVLKKAKIVNISLNSPQRHSPTLHLSQPPPHDHLAPHLFKEDLLAHAYEAVRLIAHSRLKALHSHQENIDKVQQEAFAASPKSQAASQVKIPLGVASAVEMILKMFITGRAQEDQGHNIGSSLKARQLSKKKSAKAFMQRSKENTQPASLKTQEDQANFFKGLAPNHSGEKMSHKMQVLERQLQFYKQKVGEQSSTIARLESREVLIKKKSQEQMMRVVRGKNILNIHQFFQKEYQEKSYGKYLLNVNGSTFTKKTQKPLDSTIRSNTSDRSRDRHSVIRRQKGHKQTEASQQFQKYDKNRNPLQNYNTSKKIKFQEGEGVDQLEVPEAARRERRTKTIKISLLRKELESLQQEKETLFDKLTDINQQYQHKIDSFDHQILQKLREIRKEEELLSDEELRMIKDDNFQAMEIYGFYQNENPSHENPRIET